MSKSAKTRVKSNHYDADIIRAIKKQKEMVNFDDFIVEDK
jgi:hypothetical protein